jgi:hypothetical protein
MDDTALAGVVGLRAARAAVIDGNIVKIPVACRLRFPIEVAAEGKTKHAGR